MARETNIETILVTLSARGMLLANADGTWTHDPAKTLEVFDVSGAGDTVIATVGAALAGGIVGRRGCRTGKHRGRRGCAKSGTAAACPGGIITMAGPTPPRLELATTRGVLRRLAEGMATGSGSPMAVSTFSTPGIFTF